MKKVLIFILSLVILTTSLFGANFRYPQSLQKPMQRMLSFPKAKEVLEQAQQKGRIQVKLEPFSFSSQNALWHPKSRTIVLNSQRKRNEGEVIRSVLFEIHNAKNQQKFSQINQLAKKGHINREEYIRAIEYVEFENVLATTTLLDEAIRTGYYPETAYWNMHKNFEEHYALQQRMGHSQFIGQMYDRMIS